MAFRTEAKVGAGLILWVALALGAAAPTYQVRHRHLRNGRTGVLRIDENSISYEESGRGAKHSHAWRYDDIQQLTLGAETLRIVTYDNSRWELGRDRVYDFDKIPVSLATDWYPVFRVRLDQRFVAALADDQVQPQWQIPAKLVHGRGGSQGVILVGADRVVYKSSQRGESRTWRIGDLENVNSSDTFDLTITTHEREFRFQLKQALSAARYQGLWMRVNQARGLQILSGGGRTPNPTWPLGYTDKVSPNITGNLLCL
jgi:hypothetical protein